MYRFRVTVTQCGVSTGSIEDTLDAALLAASIALDDGAGSVTIEPHKADQE